MGVDYGEKRIGLAHADDEMRMAVPHRVFTFGGNRDEDMQHLAVIIKGDADAVVIGLPLTREGTEGPMCKVVREFAEDIQFRTDLPVYFQDERLTTRENVGLLQGMPTEEKMKLADALAAASILQTWLDKNKAREFSGGARTIRLTGDEGSKK
jgi:putative Holliday junction resolvase